jgi:outer membrane protein assembly factor BamD (BamD/ComL family)
VHFLYAELLAQHQNHAEALGHYEQAAFDGDIIVNQDAAYAAISTAAKLHQAPGEARLQKEYLQKLVHYSLLFVRLYPGHKQSTAVMTRAAEEAYREGMYQQAVELAELMAGLPYAPDTYNLHSLKAHSYFKLARYRDAEAAYQALLQHYKPDPKTRAQIGDNLAVAVYNQATAAKAKGATAEALQHYLRMSELAPASGVSATGLYEAIALAFDSKLWPETVRYIERFQRLYPSHPLARDVSKKLSVAYLSTHQESAAASELIKISRTDEDIAYKTAALWKAAELYAAKKDYPAAIKTFEEYAATYPRPYPQYLEAMHKLTELYNHTQNEARVNQWRHHILDADQRASSDVKTDRTNYIGSLAALHLARQEHKNFSSIRLALPLNRSLVHKKNALQKVLNLYGRAASYGIAETATEATYGIASVYQSFSKALLESERPRHLGAAELEQYKILLEDQAFPFEDNAIKFYEKNLAYIRQGVANEWVHKSHGQLKLLFPARYARTAMLEPYINVLH